MKKPSKHPGIAPLRAALERGETHEMIAKRYSVHKCTVTYWIHRANLRRADFAMPVTPAAPPQPTYPAIVIKTQTGTRISLPRISMHDAALAAKKHGRRVNG